MASNAFFNKAMIDDFTIYRPIGLISWE